MLDFGVNDCTHLVKYFTSCLCLQTEFFKIIFYHLSLVIGMKFEMTVQTIATFIPTYACFSYF